MRRARSIEQVERWTFRTVEIVGRTIVRGVSSMPRIVARASGIEKPSVPATIAGVVGASVTLARVPLGPIAGACLGMGGTVAVLAIAAWSIRSSAGVDAYVIVLAAVLDDAIGRLRVSRTLVRTITNAAVPVRAWSAMAEAARLVHMVERLSAVRAAA